MMIRPMGRTIVFALWLLLGWTGAALAHALPGSVVILSSDEAALRVQITLALDDLVLAFPEASSLELLPISEPDLAGLERYLATHLLLEKDQVPIALKLDDVRLQAAENEHVGAFVQVAFDLSGPVPAGADPFPLILTYDVVMHEVRNHRASVYWQTPDGALQGLADFGYRPIDGQPQPVELQRPDLQD